MTRARLLTASLAAALTLAAPTADAAKKKTKRGSGTVNITQAVNQTLPEANPTTFAVSPVLSTITVGKQFKGRQIRDVNATVQTLGVLAPPDDNASFDLAARLTAPNGATTNLFGPFALNGNNVGPLILDDEAPLFLANSLNPIDPEALIRPYIGSAHPREPLALMDGGPVRGNWTLEVVDVPFFLGGNGGTSTLVQWNLNVIAGRPFQTK